MPSAFITLHCSSVDLFNPVHPRKCLERKFSHLEIFGQAKTATKLWIPSLNRLNQVLSQSFLYFRLPLSLLVTCHMCAGVAW